MSTAPPPRDYLRPHLLTLPIHRAMIRSVEARLFAELAPDLPEPILDIGSGDGTFVQIALPGKTIFGIDPLRADTREAHARGVYAGLSVASGAALPFPDGCFASAISNCVLEHVAPLDATLAETARVLRPGGRFVASVVATASPRTCWARGCSTAWAWTDRATGAGSTASPTILIR